MEQEMNETLIYVIMAHYDESSWIEGKQFFTNKEDADLACLKLNAYEEDYGPHYGVEKLSDKRLVPTKTK